MTAPDDGSTRPPNRPTMAELAGNIAARSGVERKADGQIDVLKSAGGVRGLFESLVPGLVYLLVFTFTRDLPAALVSSLAAAAVFTVVRLVQKTPATQALGGFLGVGVSALLSSITGKAEDYYLPGFFTNAAYILAFVVSIAVRWPLVGLLFGLVRNEGLHWRHDPARLKAYRTGTWVMIVVLALRLVVQVPLYLLGGDALVALAATRLLMGLPLYAAGLWVAWVLTRPAADRPAAANRGAGTA